jgi:transcriptional regulator of acetoin/glycerol metabolism
MLLWLCLKRSMIRGGKAMLEPEEVSAIFRLNELEWRSKRIARELGISRNTVIRRAIQE